MVYNVSYDNVSIYIQHHICVVCGLCFTRHLSCCIVDIRLRAIEESGGRKFT